MGGWDSGLAFPACVRRLRPFADGLVAGTAGGVCSTHGGRWFMPLWCEFLSCRSSLTWALSDSPVSLAGGRLLAVLLDASSSRSASPRRALPVRRRGSHRVGGRGRTELPNPA